MAEEEEIWYEPHSNLKSIPAIPEDCKKMIVYRNRIEEMEVDESQALSVLDLSDNQIRKIASLSKLPNLRILDLSFNLISSIDELISERLEELYLISNDVVKLENLFLPNLRKLDVASNGIKKIENLENLIELREHYLGNNHIESLENVKHLDKLEILGLQNNLFVQIDCKAVPQGLTSLILYENRRLEKIENLGYLKCLKYLDLEKTKVSRESIEIIENTDLHI
jgi:protein phosphatase 1 regulatory subunit 7